MVKVGDIVIYKFHPQRYVVEQIKKRTAIVSRKNPFGDNTLRLELTISCLKKVKEV